MTFQFKPTEALSEKILKKGPVIIDSISFERLEEDSFQIHCYSQGVLVAKLQNAVYIRPRSSLSINNLEIMSISCGGELGLFEIK